ncbi:MAG TPA: hypothetical protein VIC26_04485 [Marinagarivorans sp.]
MNFLQGLAAVILAVPTSAFAVSFDLTERAKSDFGLTYEGDYYTMSRHFSEGGIKLSVAAFSGGYNTGHYEERYGQTGHDVRRDWVSVSGSGDGLGAGGIGGLWPDNGLDNHGLVAEMMLLSFDQAVSLDFVHINWSYADSDMTILAYTGTDATRFTYGQYARDTFVGKKWDDGLAQHWDGGHFLDVANRGNTVAANPKGLTSYSWLVGAHMRPLDNVEVLSDNPYQDYLSDFVKLSAIDVSVVHEVPEIDANQSGIAFGLLLGLIAYIRERRRKHM